MKGPCQAACWRLGGYARDKVLIWLSKGDDSTKLGGGNGAIFVHPTVPISMSVRQVAPLFVTAGPAVVAAPGTKAAAQADAPGAFGQDFPIRFVEDPFGGGVAHGGIRANIHNTTTLRGLTSICHVLSRTCVILTVPLFGNQSKPHFGLGGGVPPYLCDARSIRIAGSMRQFGEDPGDSANLKNKQEFNGSFRGTNHFGCCSCRVDKGLDLNSELANAQASSFLLADFYV